MTQPFTSTIVRASDLVGAPWKDGGGTTAELAVDPPGAGYDAFRWRISLADVERDGPFSRFPGIDRTLILVEGRDLTLDVDGARHDLATPGAGLSFPGEAAVRSQLGAGPIRDLNVMTRRGAVAHTVRLIETGASPLVLKAADGIVVVASADGAMVTAGEAPTALGRLDAIVMRGAGREISIAGRAIIVALTRIAS